MGFGRYRLPAGYLSRRDEAGQGLPPGAVKRGKFTICPSIPDDLLTYVEASIQNRPTASELPLLEPEEIAQHRTVESGICT